jgi:accessory colonization factor AcfC
MTRKTCLTIFLWTLAILGFVPESSILAQEKGLRIYGPEGLSAPMKECAEIFSKKYGIQAEVLTGSEATWIARAKQEADVIYEGSEYMLTQFIANHS